MEGLAVGVSCGEALGEPLACSHDHVIPVFSSFQDPSDEDLPEVQWPGDAREACRRGAPRYLSRREVLYARAYGGRAVSDTSPGSLRGGWVALTTKRPW
jgi:hypothetical protein